MYVIWVIVAVCDTQFYVKKVFVNVIYFKYILNLISQNPFNSTLQHFLSKWLYNFIYTEILILNCNIYKKYN